MIWLAFEEKSALSIKEPAKKGHKNKAKAREIFFIAFPYEVSWCSFGKNERAERSRSWSA